MPRQSRSPFARALAVFGTLLGCLIVAIGGVVLFLPASALSIGVSTLSRGSVRLVLPSGRALAGRGELWVRDEISQYWRPWIPIEWSTSISIRENGSLSWPALVVSTNLGRASASNAGVIFQRVAINIPPSLILMQVNHPLANATWQGNVILASDQIYCDWIQILGDGRLCEGQAHIKLRQLTTSILPRQEFGDYDVRIEASRANGGELNAVVSTITGAVKVDGSIRKKNGKLTYYLSIKGENPLIEGLRSVSGPTIGHLGRDGDFILESNLMPITGGN